MGSVLVLDAQSKSALVAARKLAASGLHVTAGSETRWNAARLSRSVDRYVTYPDPGTAPGRFVDAIERELSRAEYDMLLPMHETTVDVVVRHKSQFERHTTVPFLPHERLLVGLDKRRTVEAARDAAIPQPTTLLADETSLGSVEAALDYPIVVKHPRGEGRAGVYVCESRDELERAARPVDSANGTLIFQDFVPNGGEFGVYTLYDCDGTLVGLTVQRRIRTCPPEGGASTYRETVENARLVKLADRFLTSLDWRGLAMVEFRVDARTGEPKLIEMNPRFWGSLSLSTFAGVDFPSMLYQLALGETPEPALDYEVGVRSRCLFTDTLHLLGREDRLRALREFLTPSHRPCTYDIVSIRDPLATIGQFAYYAALMSGRIA